MAWSTSGTRRERRTLFCPLGSVPPNPVYCSLPGLVPPPPCLHVPFHPLLAALWSLLPPLRPLCFTAVECATAFKTIKSDTPRMTLPRLKAGLPLQRVCLRGLPLPSVLLPPLPLQPMTPLVAE